ncbi:hypothetical protein 1 [Changjiang picorna-like virus 12]|uniref:hypothetical protein 1 n=1 Tax=Changjiang picorna-like virus 12 TaxID=1922785 RepID=UPI00090AF970|nr:hypothetical protein 1 [Changjiang picorna-like virus 12]APG78998.1 hypothetical protein 1 [Changjiang picorna-like virus 12]
MNKNNEFKICEVDGYPQQPSALIEQNLFNYFSKEITDKLKDYKQAILARDRLQTQLLGFEIRDLVAHVRRALKINTKTALLRLNLVKDDSLHGIFASDFVAYDSKWNKPLFNKLSPKRLVDVSSAQREDKTTKKQIQLSIQQQRKLKRNLFGGDSVISQGLWSSTEKVEDALDSVQDLSDKLMSIVDETDDKALPSLLSKLNVLVENANSQIQDLNVKQVFDSIMESQAQLTSASVKAQDIFKRISDLFPGIAFGSAVIIVVICAYYYVRTNEAKYYWYFCCASFFLGHCIGAEIGTWIMRMAREPTGVQTQGPSEAIGKFANLAIAGLHIGNADKGKLDKFVSFLTNSERRSQTITDIMDYMYEVLIHVANIFLSMFGYDKIYSFKKGEDERADSIFGIYENIMKRIDDELYEHNEASYKEIVDLCDMCTEYLRNTRETASNRSLVHQVRGIYSFCLNKRMAMAESHWKHTGYRPEPVCLVLVGEPGVGKTQNVEYISAAYCAKTLPASEQETLLTKGTAPYVYIRHDELEFWEGYKNKHVVTVIDDLGQRRTSVGDADSFIEVIRIINSFPYHLHMAELTKKENTFFTSRLLIVTSNMTKFQPVTLYSSDAIARRLRFKFRVKVKEEYAAENGEIDPLKLPRDANGVGVFDPREVNYYISIDDEGNAVERNGRTTHTFEQLMDMTLAQSSFKDQQRQTKQERVNDMIRDILGVKKTEDLTPIVQQSGDNILFAETKRRSVEDPFERFIEQYYTKMFDQKDLNVAAVTLTATEMISDQFIIKANLVRYYDEHNTLDGFCYYFHTRDFVHDWWMKKHHGMFSRFTEFLRSKLQQPWLLNLIEWVHNRPALLAWLSILQKVLIALGILGVAGTLGFTAYGKIVEYTSFDPETISDAELQKISSDHAAYFDGALPQSTHVRVGRGTRKYNVKVKAAVKQGGSFVTDVLNVVKANLYEFYIQKKWTTINVESMMEAELVDFSKFGTVLFTHGRNVLTPFHFVTAVIDLLDDIKGTEGQMPYVVFSPIGGSTRKRIFVSCDKFLEGILYLPRTTSDEEMYYEDYSVVELPKFVPCQRDIRKHFITDTETFDSPDVALICATKGDTTIVHGKGIALSKEKPCLVTSPSSPPTALESGWAYRIPTVAGDCGGVVVLSAGSRSRTVIGGIHVGGSTARGLGFSQKIPQSALLRFQSDHDSLDSRFEQLEVAQPDQALDAVVQQGNFQVRGRVAKCHNPYGKSKIGKSLVHSDRCQSYFDSRMAPSFLRPDAKNDPFSRALTAYCANPSFDISDECFERAYTEVKSHMLRFNAEPRVYTFEEAVRGVSDHAYFKSLNRAASAGYPYSLEGITKKMIFGDGQEYTFHTPLAKKVRLNCEQIIHKAKNGQREFHVYTDNLKDETLPKEKVDIHKTRLFCGSPLDYTIVVRMYFGDFMAYVQRHCIDLGMAIGVNPMSNDWHLIALQLLQKGGSADNARFGAGDYKRFDGSEISFVHWRILDIINAYYGDDEVGTQVRTILWYDLVNSNHIMGTTIYTWNNSLPSGHPLTSIVNSLYNHLAMCYCYYSIQREMDYQLRGTFYDNVYLVVMGDDNLFGDTYEASLFFTESNIAQHMTKLGLTYTSDTKDGINVSLRTLHDVSFLKRKFRMERDMSASGIFGLWCAPLQLEVVLETPMWFTKSKESHVDILKSNIESSLRELSLHGRSVFELWAPKLRETYYREMRQNAYIAPPLLHIEYEEARYAVASLDVMY